ncbi:MAG: xanthine dehydrogenase family protein subunit M [Dehalococcoidia bacterium]|nr:xanthine dehydrogenase family protein subunit M [Dehalococcoidia bacterium]
METFQYHCPGTLTEALSLLQQYGGEARPLAGGQSLMPLLRGGMLTPRALVDLAGIPELRSLRWDDREGLFIGATVTQRELEVSPLLREKCPALAEAISRVASVPVRNLGTLGGNLCHAGAGADPPAILIAMSASAQITGPSGTRTLPMEDLIAGPYETVLADGEVLTSIQVPPPSSGARAVYLKHSVRAIDPAIIGVGATVELQDGLVHEVRIGMVGAGPRPVRARDAEQALRGRPPENDAIRQAALAAAEESEPLSDGYASAEYRRKMVRVFVRRALEQAVQSHA